MTKKYFTKGELYDTIEKYSFNELARLIEACKRLQQRIIKPDSPDPAKRKKGMLPKYMSPDRTRTWTGCGKWPLWATEWVAKGGEIEDLRVQVDYRKVDK